MKNNLNNPSDFLDESNSKDTNNSQTGKTDESLEPAYVKAQKYYADNTDVFPAGDFPVEDPFVEITPPKVEMSSLVTELYSVKQPVPHEEILTALLGQFKPLDFQELAFPEVLKLKEELLSCSPGSERYKALTKALNEFKVTRKHQLVISIEQVLKMAKGNEWNLCKSHDFLYIYNGAFWSCVEREVFQKFLGEASEKMGIEWVESRYYQFRDQLFRQFLCTALLPQPIPTKDIVLINLLNGTFEITPTGVTMRPFNSDDFLTYQLPFEYDPGARAPLFHEYLDRVLPRPEDQCVLSEFLGYIFMRHGGKSTKEEKAMVLYGPGANGKSVLHEVVSALLGPNNISGYSLQSLTNESGYFRAKLANVLVNYASEISGTLNPAIFKQLCSGEPVEARLPYGQPFTMTQYGKLIFNCNRLPHDVEHTRAFFRRFLIIPFSVIIPESEQNKNLHTEIIDNDLSGVFNWVLGGLRRLLKNKRFTHSDAVETASATYESDSDSVNLFLEDRNARVSTTNWFKMNEVFGCYSAFCENSGFRRVNTTHFKERLLALNVPVEKRNVGWVVFIEAEGLHSSIIMNRDDGPKIIARG